MCQIRGLELLFNREKKNLKSKEDCVILLFHCLLINEDFHCVGIDDWPHKISTPTKHLPTAWNNNQTVYSLKYLSEDFKSHILLKITKKKHILQIDAVKNEDAVASMPVPVENYIDNYTEYSTAYKNLEALTESFRKNIMEKLQLIETDSASSSGQTKVYSPHGSPLPTLQRRRQANLQKKEPYGGGNPRFPNPKGSDLYPSERGLRGGMFMDSSYFGVLARPPPVSDVRAGCRGNLPRAALGATSDPNPDKPPNFDD